MSGVGSKLRPWRARQAAAAKDQPEDHLSRVTSIPPWPGPLQLHQVCGAPGTQEPPVRNGSLEAPPAAPLLPTEKAGRPAETQAAGPGMAALGFQGGILGYVNPLFSHPSERSLNSSFTRSSEVGEGTCFSPNCPEKQRTRLQSPVTPRQPGVLPARTMGSLGSPCLQVTHLPNPSRTWGWPQRRATPMSSQQ